MAHSSSSSSEIELWSTSSSSYIENWSTSSSSTSSEDDWTYTCSDATNIYFTVQSHVKCYDWANFSVAQRCASFTQAKREIEMFIGEELHDPVTSEWPINHFYACCEQALFILENISHRDGKDLTNSIKLDDKIDNNLVVSGAITLCVQCQRWMGWNRNTVQGF